MKKLTAGRKPVRRSLMALAEACDGFKGFQKDENRLERVYDVLSVAIQRCRRSTPQTFYAIRDVAAFLGVSRSTVSRVYARLAREGGLTLVRSSGTVIPARIPRTRLTVRGVVCMPIWLPGFLHFMDWRKWFSALEKELSRHHFVLEPVFYGHGEEIDSAFVDRVLKFNPDYVLWDSPVEPDRMTMESITDVGVPILTILGSNDKPLPGRIYRRSYARGLQRGLEDWKASSEIDRVVVPQAGKEHRKEYILRMLQDCAIPHEFKFFIRPDSLSQYLKHLARDRRTGIIFGDDLFFSQLCTMAPEEMVKIFRRNRVMVLRQVTLPSFEMPTDVTVDALLFPGKQLARRIATDLSQSKGALPSQKEVFEAEWRPRTPLEEIVQIDFQA